MASYTLFTLKPWMEGDKGPFYCPACGVVEGFFVYSPEVREQVEVISVDFQHPRGRVIEVLGEENQGCPVLVFEEGAEVPAYAKQSFSTGRHFIDDQELICSHLGGAFDCVKPHP